MQTALDAEQPQEQHLSRAARYRRPARRSPSASSSSDREDESENKSSSSEDGSGESSAGEEEKEDPGVSAEDETLMASLVDADDGHMSAGSEPGDEPAREDGEDGEESRTGAADGEDSRMVEDSASSDGEESDAAGEESKMADAEAAGSSDKAEETKAASPASVQSLPARDSPSPSPTGDSGDAGKEAPSTALTNGLPQSPVAAPEAAPVVPEATEEVADSGPEINGLSASAESPPAAGVDQAGSASPAEARSTAEEGAGDGKTAEVGEKAVSAEEKEVVSTAPGPGGDGPPVSSPPGESADPAAETPLSTDIKPDAENGDNGQTSDKDGDKPVDDAKAPLFDSLDGQNDTKSPKDTTLDSDSAETEPVAVKSEPDSADVNPSPVTGLSGDVADPDVKTEPGAATKSDPGAPPKTEPGAHVKPELDALLKSELNGLLPKSEEEELPVPEPIPEPKEVPPPDADHFQLVADSFESLRRLIDSFSPPPPDNSHKKKTKPPQCEVQLHAELKKILEELEPLEAKISLSVRRMRKRLCQEWLDFTKRPANYRDPGESVWREPGDPEPAPPPPPPKPATPPPPDVSDEDSADETGRRRQRSRAAKRRVTQNSYRDPERLTERASRPSRPSAAAAAAAAAASATPQVSSRGRLRKVRKLDDFDYDEEETAPARRERERERERDPAPAQRSKVTDDQDWEDPTSSPPPPERPQKPRGTPRMAVRPSPAAAPSPAWNSELDLLGAARPAVGRGATPRGRVGRPPRGRGRAIAPPTILRSVLTAGSVSARPPGTPGSPVTRPVQGVTGMTSVTLPAGSVLSGGPGKRQFLVRRTSAGRVVMQPVWQTPSPLKRPAAAALEDESESEGESEDFDDLASGGGGGGDWARPRLIAPGPVEVQSVQQLPLDHADLVVPTAPRPVRPRIAQTPMRPPMGAQTPPRPAGTGAMRLVRPLLVTGQQAGGGMTTTRIVIATSGGPVTAQTSAAASVSAAAPVQTASSAAAAAASDLKYEPDIAAKIQSVMRQLQGMNMVLTNEKAHQLAVKILAEARRKKLAGSPAVVASAGSSAGASAGSPVLTVVSAPVTVGAARPAVMSGAVRPPVVSVSVLPGQPGRVPCYRPVNTAAGSPRIQVVHRVRPQQTPASPAASGASDPLQLAMAASGLSDLVPTSAAVSQPAPTPVSIRDPTVLVGRAAILNQTPPRPAPSAITATSSPVSRPVPAAASTVLISAGGPAAQSPAPAPSPAPAAPAATKQGKIVMVERNGEQKLCIRLANGQLVELSAAQANTVREAQRRRSQAPAAAPGTSGNPGTPAAPGTPGTPGTSAAAQ